MTGQGKSAYLSFDPIGLCSCRAQTNKVIKGKTREQTCIALLLGFRALTLWACDGAFACPSFCLSKM